MHPYETPKAPNAPIADAKEQGRARHIAATSILIWIVCAVIRNQHFDVLSASFWLLLALLLFRFPKQLGIVSALLMLGCLAINLYSTSEFINFYSQRAFIAEAELRGLWLRQVLFHLPLIIGIPFAIAATWSKSKKLDKEK